MGSGASALCCCQFMRQRVYSESSDVSKMIDDQLQKEAKMKKKLVKMLLLGASDSGKSTIVKQMRILHTNGFALEEMRHYRYTIYSNCVDCASHIARAIYKQQIEVPLQQEERELIARFAQSHDGQLLNWMEFEDGGIGLVQSLAIFFELSSVKNVCQRLADLQSKMIDDQLQKEAKMKKKLVKMLLLGASDSGKSTIVKQMRILHTNGFALEEMRHYRYTIYSNCVDCASHIARAIYKQQIEVPLQQEERELIARFAQSHDGQLLNWMEFEDGGIGLVQSLAIFFELSSVKNVCQRLADLQVGLPTRGILEHAERILTPEYEPITEDIVHARASTRGIYEINFSFKNFTIRLIDVGGQKTERRKWIHCFEGVDAILFIVSLSCYNQVLEEDAKTNQMCDTIDLFKTVYRNNFLRKSFFVMFLNKKDLFRKKLQFVPLQKYFLSFGEKLHSNMNEKEVCKEALKFIRQQFLEVKGDDYRQIYSHVTNATDAKNIDFVFNATCDIVISNNMKNAAMN